MNPNNTLNIAFWKINEIFWKFGARAEFFGCSDLWNIQSEPSFLEFSNNKKKKKN